MHAAWQTRLTCKSVNYVILTFTEITSVPFLLPQTSKTFFSLSPCFFRDTTWIASWSSNSLWEMTWLQAKQHTLKSNEKIKYFRNRLLVISTWVFHFKSYLIVLKSTYLAIQLIWTCCPADIVQVLPLCFSVRCAKNYLQFIQQMET